MTIFHCDIFVMLLSPDFIIQTILCFRVKK